MKITIDLDDRHVLDGATYVRIVPADEQHEVKLLGHVKAADVVHHKRHHAKSQKKKRAVRTESADAPSVPLPPGISPAEAVKLRNQAYEDRRDSKAALAAIQAKNRLTEHAVEQNIINKNGVRWDEDSVAKVIKLVGEGRNDAEIGKAIGKTPGAVAAQKWALRKKGLLQKVKRHATA